MSSFSTEEVAVWLINLIKDKGRLEREEAANFVESTFDSGFISQTPNGNKSLAQHLLRDFRSLRDDSIIWNAGEQAWFFKTNGDQQEKEDLESIPSIPTAVEAQDIPEGTSNVHPSLYLNRELGWMDFNWRVLYQAMDPRTPLLERVRFLGITASNLDEFIQKRVGGLKRQEAAGVDDLSPDGRTPETQIELLQRKINEMQQKMAEVWNHELQPLLKEEASIQITDYAELDSEQQNNLDEYFLDHIYPTLTPLAVDPGHPFPFISNLSLSLAVKLKKPNRQAFNFARVKIPTNQPRLLRVAGGSTAYHYVPIEEVIRKNIGKLFPGMKIESTCLFRVTRNADLRRNEEEAEDLLAMISEELRERRFAEVVRLEIENNVDPEVEKLLKNEIRLEDSDIQHVEGLLDLTMCFSIANLNIPGKRYEKWNPPIPKPLYHEGETEQEQNIFDIIRKGDILVHHPYESFSSSVQRLIEEAANDPDVLAIKQTLYRTSDDSPIVKSLIKAAEQGKQVAVLVEVKARFDEASNIEWGKMLENAGVHVAYGLVGLKTHAKVALIVRREGDEHITYCHIGTGNYHTQTAEIYTDLGLLTNDPVLCHDVTNLFHYLTGYAPDQKFQKLMVAPHSLRTDFYNLIDCETELAKQGKEGRIIAKMNALDDVGIIQRLYEASQAGVQIDLIVRGHSRLRPQLKGYSDNIRIISIIGRFLEHDRIFYFGNDGDPKIFIGSADWRSRNLNERVEAIVPITLPSLQKRIISILKKALNDNRLAWDMHPDGSYTQRRPEEGQKEKNFHHMMMKNAWKRARR
ncbi:polyphosphate kinase 1 [Aliifodinibius sp. S!AR15-10]|uniref:polyphosphate kinase 1 n=1 Tax=Aliifodinibius sp. S!AR15-10 TaxID=2950437 RepID=UPI00285E7BDE|nr:polyphosphate kinase 1 [Aliifodinibius sp. S!AR15-10]MDR8393221.1 polyphosphate kinase 1 [Aliifodinibius sp. S!AR15-10]